MFRTKWMYSKSWRYSAPTVAGCHNLSDVRMLCLKHILVFLATSSTDDLTCHCTSCPVFPAALAVPVSSLPT